MPADFEKQSYWRERFASETSFEWLASSATFMSMIEPWLSGLPDPDPARARVLQLGSGTSDLQNCFRARGYLDVTNVDYEPLAIERGRQLEARAFGDVRTKYAVADATQLDRDLDRDRSESRGLSSSSSSAAAPRTFDVVVDKSTVDAVSCGGVEPFLRMASAVRRCLTRGGFWISLSYSSRRFDVDGLPFSVEVIGRIPTPKLGAGDPEVYYCCYLLRPKRDEPGD